MSKYSGSGWHFQSLRHSRARKYGHAGGKYLIRKVIAGFNVASNMHYEYYDGTWHLKEGTLKENFNEPKLIKELKYKKKHYGEAYSVLNRSILQSIGARAGLDALRQIHFIKFMQKRLPNERDESYATEWAIRFKRGTEWDRADMVSRQVLYDIDPKRYENDKRSILKKGDYVAVMKATTTDPYNRRGQIGNVATIDADNVVTIIFPDSQIGKYDEDTLILLKA
jgi:hypothetical protein